MVVVGQRVVGLTPPSRRRFVLQDLFPDPLHHPHQIAVIAAEIRIASQARRQDAAQQGIVWLRKLLSVSHVSLDGDEVPFCAAALLLLQSHTEHFECPWQGASHLGVCQDQGHSRIRLRRIHVRDQCIYDRTGHNARPTRHLNGVSREVQSISRLGSRRRDGDSLRLRGPRR